MEPENEKKRRRKAERNLRKVSYHTIYFYTKINNMNTKCWALHPQGRNLSPISPIPHHPSSCVSCFAFFPFLFLAKNENNAKRLLKAAQAPEKRRPSTRRLAARRYFRGFTVDLSAPSLLLLVPHRRNRNCII